MRDIGVDRKIPTGESFSHEREYTRPEEIKILQKYLKAGIQALADSTELEENTSDENKLIVSSISSLNDSRIDLPGELQTQLDNSVTDLLDSRENKLDSRVENISSEGIKELDSNRENINDTSKGEGDLIDNPNVIRLDVPQGDIGLDKSVIEISDKEDVKLSEGSEILRDDSKVELDKSVSEITENNIDRLSNQVEEISEKPLTTLDKILEKLQGKNISDLDNRITEISDKKDIKLDSSSLKIKIAGLKELSEESEKIDPGKTPDLDKTITELSDSTEVGLTDDSEKISSDIKIDLDSSITELSDKKDIDLSEKSEELKDDRKINLSDESETITENKVSKLSELRENIKNLEEVNLDDKKETITDEKQKELNDSIIQISDSKEVKLKEKSEKIKTDIKTELNLSSEKLENETKLDKLSEDFQSITNENEPELNNTITELSNSDISNLNNSVENISPQDISDLNSSREGLENNIKTESLNNSREEFKNTIEPELNDSRESLDDPSVETDGNGHITSSTTELNDSREEFKNEKEVELDNSREDFSGIDVELNDSKEEISGVDVELNKSKEDIKGIDVDLNDSRDEFKNEKEVELDKSKEDIKGIDVELNKSREDLSGIDVDLNDSREEFKNEKEVELNKSKEDIKGIDVDLNDSKEEINGVDADLDNSREDIKYNDNDNVSLRVQSKQIDKKNKIDTKKSENSDKHSNLKASRLVEAEVKKNTPNEKLDDPNYTKASGYKIKLDKEKSEIDKAGASHPVSSTGPSQTQIDAVKLYLGLTTSEGTSYEKAASILDKCGDWGKKVIAQLTNTLVQEKGKKPYELLDPAKVQTFYDSVKNTYSMDDPDADEVFGIESIRQETEKLSVKNNYKDLEKLVNDDTFYLNRGKGKNVGMLKYKSPDSANSALELINNPSAGIRALVELAVNALNAKGKTKQLLLDEAVGLAVLARDEAQKLAGADPGRLPGRAGVLEGMLQTYASGKGLVNTALSGIGDYFFDSPVKKDPLNRPYAYVKGQKIEGVNKLGGDTTWESLEKPKELQKGIFVEKSLDGLFLTRFKDKNSGNGFDTTLSELVISGSNSSESELYKSNYEKFISGLKQSPYITTSSNLVDWRQEDRDMLTLDSNHVWEIRLFPYTGPENGNLSYLPTFSQLNFDNKINFGYKTRWNGWIPFSGFEFQQAKVTGKSTSLFDGEINYPISIEFTNELRLSLSDDSFKSWKRYFMACSEAAIYHCTRSYQSVDYQTIDYVNTDLTGYIERGVLCPKNYKNITFRCLIYIMNPQFYTVRKLDLLVVLRDFLIDWQGENDASSTDLSLTFSVVGESPAAETPVIPSYTIPKKEEPEQKDWGGIVTSKLSQIIGVL